MGVAVSLRVVKRVTPFLNPKAVYLATTALTLEVIFTTNLVFLKIRTAQILVATTLRSKREIRVTLKFPLFAT